MVDIFRKEEKTCFFNVLYAKKTVKIKILKSPWYALYNYSYKEYLVKIS